MELKKKEAEMSEEGLKRKRKHEEIQDLVSKKKKMELGYINTFQEQKWQRMKASSQYKSKVVVVGNFRAW